MNKQDLSALVAEILGELGQEPQVKGSDYKPAVPGPRAVPTAVEEGFVEDVTKLDLRKLYLTEAPRKREEYARLKARTPARPSLSNTAGWVPEMLSEILPAASWCVCWWGNGQGW